MEVSSVEQNEDFNDLLRVALDELAQKQRVTFKEMLEASFHALYQAYLEERERRLQYEQLTSELSAFAEGKKTGRGTNLKPITPSTQLDTEAATNNPGLKRNSANQAPSSPSAEAEQNFAQLHRNESERKVQRLTSERKPITYFTEEEKNLIWEYGCNHKGQRISWKSLLPELPGRDSNALPKCWQGLKKTRSIQRDIEVASELSLSGDEEVV